ncbi:hypothetical protein Hdeb2414_s0011g00365611 [Helianthus debilis subsp. tardiflorus]
MTRMCEGTTFNQQQIYEQRIYKCFSIMFRMMQIKKGNFDFDVRSYVLPNLMAFRFYVVGNPSY